MNFREMTEQDVEYMKTHSVSRGILKHQPIQTEFCFTLENRGNILGIGGFRLINQTTAWCWCDLTEWSHDHVIVTYRVIKEWIDIFVETHGLKRLQAYIEPDFPEAIRMIQHLGFKKESTLESFLPDGRNAFMYKRII